MAYKWVKKNSTSDQQMIIQEWLLESDTTDDKDKVCAISSDTKTTVSAKSSSTTKTPSNENKLIRLMINNEDKPPYRQFCRYKFEVCKQDSSIASISTNL